MFTLVTLDNRTYLIVKEEVLESGSGLPVAVPFEVYGFLYKQTSRSGASNFSLLTPSPEVKKEKKQLIKLAQHKKAALF